MIHLTGHVEYVTVQERPIWLIIVPYVNFVLGIIVMLLFVPYKKLTIG